jgi:AcrR family transcriptional regulator
MPRTIPADRFRRLAHTATDVFIRHGYRRTQMSDVAEALGVAKGTLYLYVESKEALFDLAIRNADREHLLEVPDTLPLPTPDPRETIVVAGRYLAERGRTPVVLAAISKASAQDIAAEVDSVSRELYGVCARNRRAIKLIDRCAADHPEIGALWFQRGREGQLDLLLRYFDARPELGTGYADKAVLARIIIEMIAFWAIHRHWDPHPQKIDDNVAEEIVASFIRRALLQEHES